MKRFRWIGWAGAAAPAAATSDQAQFDTCNPAESLNQYKMLTDIASRRCRSKNPAARIFATTFCTPDSAGSRRGSLWSASHAIARRDCQEGVPYDTSHGRAMGCVHQDSFSACGERVSGQNSSHSQSAPDPWCGKSPTEPMGGQLLRQIRMVLPVRQMPMAGGMVS